MSDKTEKSKICLLAKDGRIKKICKLSSHPRFICKKCCRVANSEKNLCKAKPLNDPN